MRSVTRPARQPRRPSGRLRRAVFLLVALAPLAAAAQSNVVVNGDFASAADLSGWQTAASSVWSTLDRNADPTSGSAFASNDSAAANTRLTQLSQCIPLTQRGHYLFGASAYVAPTGVQGGLVMSVIAHPTAGCNSGGPSSGIFLPSSGAWRDYEFGIGVASLPAAMEVLLIVEKDDAGGTYGGFFDNVHVVLDTVFLGDFE